MITRALALGVLGWSSVGLAAPPTGWRLEASGNPRAQAYLESWRSEAALAPQATAEVEVVTADAATDTTVRWQLHALHPVVELPRWQADLAQARSLPTDLASVFPDGVRDIAVAVTPHPELPMLLVDVAWNRGDLGTRSHVRIASCETARGIAWTQVECLGRPGPAMIACEASLDATAVANPMECLRRAEAGFADVLVAPDVTPVLPTADLPTLPPLDVGPVPPLPTLHVPVPQAPPAPRRWPFFVGGGLVLVAALGFWLRQRAR